MGSKNMFWKATIETGTIEGSFWDTKDQIFSLPTVSSEIIGITYNKK